MINDEHVTKYYCLLDYVAGVDRSTNVQMMEFQRKCILNLFYREVYKIDKNFADMKIAPLYHKSLLREGFTEKQVNLISSEAYDRGHHAGQDEVISYMREIALFSKDIIAAGKK